MAYRLLLTDMLQLLGHRLHLLVQGLLLLTAELLVTHRQLWVDRMHLLMERLLLRNDLPLLTYRMWRVLLLNNRLWMGHRLHVLIYRVLLLVLNLLMTTCRCLLLVTHLSLANKLPLLIWWKMTRLACFWPLSNNILITTRSM